MAPSLSLTLSNSIAQGNALGTESTHVHEALKGRNNRSADLCFALSGLGLFDGTPTQGVALGYRVLAFQATRANDLYV